MKLTDEQIANRLGSVALFRAHREKIHKIRRLVAGDVSVLKTDSGSSAIDYEMSQATRPAQNRLYDILVTEVEEGRPNKLMWAVRTLISQVGITFPDFEFPNLSGDMSVVHAAYIKDRATRCNMSDVRKLALADYLISGTGVTFNGMRDGIPCCDFVDSLDFVWDLSASTTNEMRWAGHVVRNPLGEWLEYFDKKDATALVKALKANVDDDLAEDMPIALMCYYDINRGSNDGNLAYFWMESEDDVVNPENLISRGANPYKTFVSGEPRVTIPYTISKFLNLPGVKPAISIAEMMLSEQIALWEARRAVRDAISTGRPSREYAEGAYTNESLERWLNDPSQILIRQKQASPTDGMQVTVADPVSPYLAEEAARAERSLMEMAGVNPYVSGNTVQNTKFASEVQAIQSNATLISGVIAKDEAAAWKESAELMLANGKMYDRKPLQVQGRDGEHTYVLKFDAKRPVSDILDPTTLVLVSEDSISFTPKHQKLAQAATKVEMGLKLAGVFPEFLKKAVEEFLVADGQRNPQEWLSVPQQPLDPAAMAGANTQAMVQ